MDLVFRRRSGATALYGLLIASLVFVVTSPARITAVSESCAELREWASRFVNASPTLDDLTPFTLSQRAAIFNAVTPTVRAELWREHLRRFATRSDLNDTQRAFILQARADLSAATYTDRDPQLRRGQARQVWASAQPHFLSPEHQHAWFVLGEFKTPTIARSSSDRAHQGTRGASGVALTGGGSLITPNVSQYPACNCNGDDGWLVCASGICGGGTCHTVWACGFMGQDMCTGWCEWA